MKPPSLGLALLILSLASLMSAITINRLSEDVKQMKSQLKAIQQSK